MARLSVLRRLICPSAWPSLQGSVIALRTAARPCRSVAANCRVAWMPELAASLSQLSSGAGSLPWEGCGSASPADAIVRIGAASGRPLPTDFLRPLGQADLPGRRTCQTARSCRRRPSGGASADPPRPAAKRRHGAAQPQAPRGRQRQDLDGTRRRDRRLGLAQGLSPRNDHDQLWPNEAGSDGSGRPGMVGATTPKPPWADTSV